MGKSLRAATGSVTLAEFSARRSSTLADQVSSIETAASRRRHWLQCETLSVSAFRCSVSETLRVEIIGRRASLQPVSIRYLAEWK